MSKVDLEKVASDAKDELVTSNLDKAGSRHISNEGSNSCYTHHDGNDDDDDDECWDDAKEDHNADTGSKTLNSDQANTSNNEKVNTASTTFNNGATSLTSSTSAYSSINSASTKCADTSLSKLSLNEENLWLHEAVFNNDANRIYAILKDKELAKQIINKKDKHGNTALHLACMLGRSKEMVSVLLQCGAAVDCKNLNRWTPFHEACSFGNREIITLMTKRLNDVVHDALNKNKLSENLAKTKNYRLVLKWEFQSWVPFLTRVLPSDICVINKQDKFIRIDTKLLGFEMRSWKRGDSCLIYSDKFEKKWIIMNNKTKKYQHFETQSMEKDLEDKVDEIMSTDIMDFELKSTNLQMTRLTSGWIWKADKTEVVGKYNTALYNFNNVFIVTRKRREHLTEKDLKRNKMAHKSALHMIKFGLGSKEMEDGAEGEGENSDNRSDSQEDSEEAEVQHRESLSPPPPTNVSWKQYCQAEPPGRHPILGRAPKCKVVKTAFKASVAMSDDFPITKDEFLDLLSIVPLKLFKKLKEFIEMRLPDGFPVRLDIPVFSFLTARITFEDFAFVDGPVEESLFTIPPDFEEDPNLFPLLSGKFRRNSSPGT